MGIKRLIDQWNTKTAGGADKLSVSDYHLIQDPIHIQDTNIDALELTNTVGQATNTQSQSGPIVGTLALDAFQTDTDDDYFEMFAPEEGGGIWSIIPQWEIDRADSVSFYLGTSGTKNIIRVAYFSTTAPDIGNEWLANIHLEYPYILYAYIAGATDDNYLSLYRIRVR